MASEPMMSTGMDSFQTEEVLDVDIDRIEGLTGSPSKSNSSSSQPEESQPEDLVMDPNVPVRARVFALADDGSWKDLATGIFVLDNDIINGCQYFRIMDQNNPEECLFEAVIEQDKMVNLQNDSVLGWRPEDGCDMALSFEYAACLSDIWHRICMFQRRPPEFEYFGGHVKIALPELVDPNTIPLIESALNQYSNFVGLRGPLGDLILEQRYIPQLLDQFKLAHERQESALTQMIFNITRMLILLNHRVILEELFCEHSATFVAEIFENDAGLASKPDYKSFFLNQSKLKLLFPLESPQLEHLMNQSIRTQFFKDVILPRYIDDEIYSNLTLQVRSLLNDIVVRLDSNPSYFNSLSSMFSSTDYQIRLELLKFFKDFIAICRASNLRTLRFFKEQVFKDFLEFLQKTLNDLSEANSCAPLAAEMLLSLCQLESPQIQNWMKQQSGFAYESQLFSVIIDRLHIEKCSGIRWHLVSILRILLDPPNPTGANPEAVTSFESFNDYFYSKHALALLRPFTQIQNLIESRKLTEQEADIYFHLCELTSTFILLHKYKIKYLLARDQILTGVCSLMSCHLTFVKLASIRLFRTILSVKEEFYYRLMISSHLFDRLLSTLNSCISRDNLLRAALLDFFVSLHQGVHKRLIDELVPKWREEMQRLGSLHEVFFRLITLYDSNYAIEGSQDTISQVEEDRRTGPSVQNGDKWDKMDLSEEDYFSQNDDDSSGEVPSEISSELPDLPPIKSSNTDEDESSPFGTLLLGKPSTSEKIPLKQMGSRFKNSIKTGFGLWKLANKSNEPPQTDNELQSASMTEGSPSKKTKHDH